MTEAAVSVTSAEIVEAIDEARALRHKHRSMRVTLECSHLRLMPWLNCVMGIGSLTACNVCPPDNDGHAQARTVVNVEETGHLDGTWIKWRTAQKQGGHRG